VEEDLKLCRQGLTSGGGAKNSGRLLRVQGSARGSRDCGVEKMKAIGREVYYQSHTRTHSRDTGTTGRLYDNAASPDRYQNTHFLNAGIEPRHWDCRHNSHVN
jgi:hypothetical protein